MQTCLFCVSFESPSDHFGLLLASERGRLNGVGSHGVIVMPRDGTSLGRKNPLEIAVELLLELPTTHMVDHASRYIWPSVLVLLYPRLQ